MSAGRLSMALAAVIVLAVLGVAGCGSSSSDDSAIQAGSRTVTVYSSLPLLGSSRRQSEDMVNAIKLALDEAHGRAGALAVNYVSLSSAPRGARDWTSDQVLENARRAVKDPNTIAYIGDLDSSATALSLPLLNEGGVLQISSSSTYLGLTEATGGRKGEPERFYPSGQRTFGRVVPADNIQAAALVAYMKAQGVKSVAILDDRDLYGTGIADEVAQVAKEQGLEVLSESGIDGLNGNLTQPAAQVAQSGADAFFFGGGTDTGAARVFTAVAHADPTALLFGPDAVAESAFTQAIAPAVQRRMRITTPTLQPSLLPPAGARFESAFRAKFGRAPEPYAIYAYDAMGAALQAITAAGAKGNDRAAVIKAFFAIRNRHSALGTYSINANGDTSLSTYSGRRVQSSKLVFDKVLKVRT